MMFVRYNYQKILIWSFAFIALFFYFFVIIFPGEKAWFYIFDNLNNVFTNLVMLKQTGQILDFS